MVNWKSQIKNVMIKFNLIRPILTANENLWQEQAQSFELDFHKGNLFRQSDAFVDETNRLFESFGFQADQFVGKTIIDIGAGSRMRANFFSGADIVAVEPLASKFIEEIPWCDLGSAKKVISEPAEVLIPELVDKADFIFSINVLDHCYDFTRIIDNACRYLKSDGLCFLSFDSHLHTSVGHPLILLEKPCRKIFTNAGFRILDFKIGFSQSYQIYRGRNGYDGNSPCLNFWLGKN
jgi:hypothetical protein